MRQTHTYAELRVSRRAYFEIRKRLEDAGVLKDYTLRERPEKIILPNIALEIDKEWDDSKDCRDCNEHFICAVHSAQGS